MNKQRSPGEQMILFALLAFSAYLLSQQFFGNNKGKGGQVEKPAPQLAEAFKGLDSLQGAPLSKEAALKEVSKLQAEVQAGGKDEYSYWARLRTGLLQQYVLKNAVEARKSYDEVVHRNKTEAVDAQAVYQKGDLLWRQAQSKAAPAAMTPAAAEQANGVLLQEGAQTLEQILVHSRGHQAFLDNKIFVPDIESARGDPLQLPARWEQLPLKDLMGKGSTLPATTGNPDPRFILTRVDQYYSTTPLYKVFDTVVRWFNANPAYSYGLALIVLALVTRLIMQPLIKKQYDSMKGMSLIAPEMKKIQDKYKGKTDQESQVKMMQEIRALQKSHGVNPMGCGLSLIIQMPLFFFIVLPLINHYQARMELSGAHFLWIRSLAHPDIPLLVLYAISMFVSVRLSSTPPADEQQAQMQKMTTFMSPLFALVLWSYPSAFIMYWMTYNVLSTALQWRMMKASDPDKNVIKTLIGSGAPMAQSVEVKSDGAAIPPRPGGKKSTASGEVTSLSLNGASSNGTQSEEAAEEYSTLETTGAKSGNGSSSKAARRRRRRK